MSWKLVSNWQQMRTVELSELWWHWPVSSTPPKHYTKTGGHNISSSLKKKRKHTQWVTATIRVQVLQETPHLTRPDRNGDKTRRRMTSERQINSLPGLLSVKMIRHQISITNRLTYQSTTFTNERRQWRIRAEHHRLESGPPHDLWGDCTFIRTSLFLTDAWPPSRFH